MCNLSFFLISFVPLNIVRKRKNYSQVNFATNGKNTFHTIELLDIQVQERFIHKSIPNNENSDIHTSAFTTISVGLLQFQWGLYFKLISSLISGRLILIDIQCVISINILK